MMKNLFTPRELAVCGLFGAAALLLPVIFHAVHLGRIFMPMYLPLVMLAFLVRPLPAAVTALVTPLISGAATGMPPFYPPVALLMSVELSVMAALIGFAGTLFPRAGETLILVPVLLLGRVMYVGLMYAVSRFIDLPAEFMAGLSFVSGWPGIILMIVVVPMLVKVFRTSAGYCTAKGKAGNERY
jgi:hypothetical protein